MQLGKQFQRVACGVMLALGVAILAGCASTIDTTRKDRDKGLKDGDFLAALAQSRQLYRSGPTALTDIAAHCGLVFAVANYSEARECTDRLLNELSAAEAILDREVEKQLNEEYANPGVRHFKSRELVSALESEAFDGKKLSPRWRESRFGVEKILALHNLRWRAQYLRGKIDLDTGDFAGARQRLSEAREMVNHQWPYGKDRRLSLAAIMDGSEVWRFEDVEGAGSDDSRAWWIDLLGSLSIASSASHDDAQAISALTELEQLHVSRELDGYKQSRLAFANMAAGRLAAAKKAADADPEQYRRNLRVGGAFLSGGILIYALLTAAALSAAPAASLGTAFANAIAAAATLILGVAASVITFAVSRIAGKDTTWDLTQRWYAVARISRDTGDDAKADATYKKLLEQDAVLQSQPAIQWQVYADLGQWHEKAGRDDEAIAFYQRAIDVIEATRRNIAAEAAKIGFISDKQQVYQRLMQLRLKRGQVAQAFELSEQARARALLDILATRDWTQALDAQVAQRGELLKLVETQESEARLAILQDKPAQTTLRRNALKSLGERIQAEDTQLAALTHIKRYTLDEIRARLDAHEVLLSFVPVGNELVAFAVSRDELRHWRLPAGEVNGRVGLLRHAIEQHSVSASLTRDLAQQLFAGLAPMNRFDKLSVVPTGSLHALPFAALQTAGGALPDTVSLRILPSASILPLLNERPRQAAAMSVMAFGNPDFGGQLQSLPNTEAEVDQVTRIVGAGQALTGREASKANVLSHSAQATVLHFATHSQFDAERPLQSSLYLSDGQGGATTLTASDFYGMRIGARLVTLSACETGLGTVKSGDEVIGLYRALMFAGADTIVASLWEVDDASTSFLMTRFYTHLKTHDAPTALHMAQRDTAQKWPEPFHWAGFAVIGLERPFGQEVAVSPSPSASAPAH
ncbi:CHAT domain-containing protein [Piscinibacter terrae]|uniref:CHAT domain-containing protein n=1 Tax=Piscinibacter terrae TaxID=2496871 RepID=UPI000F5AECB3|nr:CHAT domain-containing protein [Albitalea terrae]